MEYEEFLNKAAGEGTFEDSGSIRIDLEGMRKKFGAGLREGKWAVALLQAAVTCEVKELHLSHRDSSLEFRFQNSLFPKPDRMAPLLVGEAQGAGSEQWVLLRALLRVPEPVQVEWFCGGSKLSRKDGEWSLFTGLTGTDHRLLFSSKEHPWEQVLRTCRDDFPLPPLHLTLNGETCWQDLSAGSTRKLFFCHRAQGEELTIHTHDLRGRVGSLQRLGLCAAPFHQITFLRKGARIQHVILPFKTSFLCTEIFVSGEQLSTDVSGFQARHDDEGQTFLHERTVQALQNLRALLSHLISRPGMPLRREERQRRETAIGSAVALGGLALLQFPLLPPWITLSFAGLIAGGVGLRSVALRRSEPWRGEQGFHLIRRDLVELRKQVDMRLNYWND